MKREMHTAVKKQLYLKNQLGICTNNRQQNGITLIALVVTIIVLIILAVISINAVFGENGLISSAEIAELEHTHATVWEQMEIVYSDYWIGKVADKEEGLIKYLQDKHIIGSEIDGGYVISIQNLLGKKMRYGNGQDGKSDVYRLEPASVQGADITKIASTREKIRLGEIESADIKYQVAYYGPKGDRVLGILGDSISSTVEVENANIDIEKRLASNPAPKEFYVVGDQIHYEIEVRNIGNVTMTGIKITDVLVAGSGTYTPQADGKGELVLGEDNSDNVHAEDGFWVIDSLESNQSETIRYSYTVQEGDVGDSIKNTIMELTGKPKPRIPKGEKEPDIEEEVQVPVLGSVPVKKILHLTYWTTDERTSSNGSGYIFNNDCLNPTFELYDNDGHKCASLMLGATSWGGGSVPWDSSAWPSDPVKKDLVLSGSFVNVPVGDYKLKETTRLEQGAIQQSDHVHDERVYSVSVLSETETKIWLDEIDVTEATFEDTCWSHSIWSTPKTCFGTMNVRDVIHIRWEGWSENEEHPILGKDIIMEIAIVSSYFGTGAGDPTTSTWNIDERSLVDGREGWYASDIVKCYSRE